MNILKNQVIRIFAFMTAILTGTYSTGLSASYSFAPQCEIYSNGSGVAVWNTVDNNGNTVIMTALYSSGTWSNYYTVSYDISELIVVNNTPKMCCDSNGDTAISWQYFDSNGNGYLAVSLLPAGTTTWYSQTLSPTTENVSTSDQQIKLNNAGNVMATWSSINIANPSLRTVWFSTTVMGPSPTWSTPASIP